MAASVRYRFLEKIFLISERSETSKQSLYLFWKRFSVRLCRGADFEVAEEQMNTKC